MRSRRRTGGLASALALRLGAPAGPRAGLRAALMGEAPVICADRKHPLAGSPGRAQSVGLRSPAAADTRRAAVVVQPIIKPANRQ